MKLVNCATAATILAAYFPDEQVTVGAYDTIHFAPPSEENFNKVPVEVREQLRKLGIHYNDQDGFYGFN